MNDFPTRAYPNVQRQDSAKAKPSSPANDRDLAISKRSRGRSGCLNCRRRRKKCDESKPACLKCDSRGETCTWDTGLTFRLSGIDARHPSMVQSRSSKPDSASTYEIINITFDDDRDSRLKRTGLAQYPVTSQNLSTASDEELLWESNEIPATPGLSSISPTDRLVSNNMSTENNEFSEQECTKRTKRFHHRSETSSGPCGTNPTSNDLSRNNMLETYLMGTDTSAQSAAGSDTAMTVVSIAELPSANTLTPGARHSKGLNGHQNNPPQPDLSSIELEALDYLTCHSSNMHFVPPTNQSDGPLVWHPVEDSGLWSSPVASNSNTTESPEANTMSYPNATYKDLHTTLYHHMVETARNTALTRQGTPDPLSQKSTTASHDAPESPRLSRPTEQLQELRFSTMPSSSTKPHKRRQFELWRNYLDEIAVWLDMFDSERHFQLKIPLLAKTADHLHYSILALSARQIERKDPEKPYTESLGLYQEAIQLVLQELHTLDTAVIASCVLLCVLEMMSSSPRAWGRHLDGCAMLLEAAGINGVVGGVRQSLFWCFARMDVWGGFLGDTLTKIPTSRWFVPSKSMVDAISHFRGGSGCDTYANYAVFLCASVVNVISSKGGSSADQDGTESVRTNAFSARWKALFDLLEEWYSNRPEEMQSIMSFPSVSEEYRHPFPIVLYSTSPAINGNQLYHAATILMLQEKPKDLHLPKNAKSILWHARQICGIAASNYSHGSWINALQPLWIAGKIMSHESEHNAILEILTSIERETGWATAWRARDLKEYWGDAHS